MTFEELMAQYSAIIKRIASSYTPPGAQREDLEQDISMALYQAMDHFRHESSWKTYVYRIAHNRGMRTISQRPPTPQHPAEHTQDASSPDHAPSPEQLTMQKQRYEQLASHIRALPLKWRQPLTMMLDGLSYQDIADILDLEQSTVGVRIHRAKQALKARLSTIEH